MTMTTMDEITTPPTGTGPHGRWWRVDYEKFVAAQPKRNPDDSTVSVFLIEAPYAHPIWHSYMLCAIHLRPIEGRPEPLINLPGATHEMFLYALNPGEKREPFIVGADGPRILQPANFAAQLICDSDDAATALMLKTAQDIADGTLNPDTDYIKFWAQRFGTSMLKEGWDEGTKISLDGKHTFTIPPHQPPSAQKPPTSMEELSARFAANQKITGFGLEVATHMPCGFCGAPDLFIMPITDAQSAMVKGSVCKECGRGTKALFTEHDGGISFEIVQTSGDDPPAWLAPPHPRRLSS